MITLKIGNEERKGSGIEERWIAQQIQKRKKDGQLICVKIVILEGDISLPLISGACSKTAGGGWRPPNIKERKIIKLWNERGLNERDVNTGMIISFLRQYRQYA